MEYEEYFDARDTGSRGGIPRVFVGSPYQRGHGIGSFLDRLFKKILPFLNKGARAIGKEALRARINVIEDVENNKPLKKAVKSRLAESRGNLKRKAKEKMNSLMRESGYKKYPRNPRRFSFHSVVEIDVSRIINDVERSKENH